MGHRGGPGTPVQSTLWTVENNLETSDFRYTDRRPVGRMLAAVLLGVVLGGGPACGLIFPRHSESNRDEQKTETVLEVESHHWSDIVIYLVNGSQAQRLGMVNGVSTNRFILPYRYIASGGRLRLRAHPVGGQESFTSEDVSVQPGQWVKWILESDLRRSSLAVY